MKSETPRWRPGLRDASNKARNSLKIMNILTRSRSTALAVFLLVMAGLATKAETSFTSEHIFTGIPFIGPSYNDSSGLLHLKGIVQQQPELANDPRATGRLTSWTEVDYQSDGTAIRSGHGYLEVGMWDAARTNFTPSGGLWALNIRGVIQTNGDTQFTMTGYGIGGDIERMRFTETVTMIPGPMVTRFLGSGTIKSAPVDIREVVDDFADNHFTWRHYGVGAAGFPTGTFFASETNQQLTIGGIWPRTTSTPMDATAWANPDHDWAVSDGQTFEARVDVLALSPTAAGVQLALWSASGGAQAYYVLVGRNGIALAKLQWSGLAVFRGLHGSIRDTNIVLSLALTPVGNNVVLTGKVLDKDSGKVIAQVVATDTPASDPTLSAIQLAALFGGRVWQGGVVRDQIGSPFTSGAAVLISVHQESEVAPVTAFATFENLEHRTYEVPQVGIERAVRLSWPSTGMPFAVEAAPTIQGPWLPVVDPVLPGMQYFTVPANDQMGLFRVQQAP